MKLFEDFSNEGFDLLLSRFLLYYYIITPEFYYHHYHHYYDLYFINLNKLYTAKAVSYYFTWSQLFPL